MEGSGAAQTPPESQPEQKQVLSESAPGQQLTPAQQQEERTYGMLCHLTALSGMIVPLGNIIGPLIIWLMKKDQYSLVDDQGKESLNFQISVTIYLIVSAVLTLILIGLVLMLGVLIFALIMVILASIEANKGARYRYPLTIRFIT